MFRIAFGEKTSRAKSKGEEEKGYFRDCFDWDYDYVTARIETASRNPMLKVAFKEVVRLRF